MTGASIEPKAYLQMKSSLILLQQAIRQEERNALFHLKKAFRCMKKSLSLQ